MEMEINMKKTLLNLSTLSALVLASGVAHAATPSAELTVVGTLTVPTCTVAAVNDGVYDLGNIASTLIKATGTTVLNSVTQGWTVTCDATTYLNFTPLDNRAESKSASAVANFGLGTVNTEGKIGYFTADVKNAKVDGVATSLFTTNTTSLTPLASVKMNAGIKTGWVSAANTQAAGRVFTADITVNPVLGNTTDMKGPITDTADIDGSVTLNFAYGI
jgi:hypothetical protein